MKDLVVLVADKNTEYTTRGLLARPESLSIRSITYDIFVHPRRDPGCLNEAHDLLRPWAKNYRYALVMFDHEGCGQEKRSPDTLANKMRERLRENGWSKRAEVVVLSPELEVWVWSQSVHVAACLGWNDMTSLREWLATNGCWPPKTAKPPRPKEAMQAALRQARIPRSSVIYLALAEKVGLRGHDEPAFLRFTRALRGWFPPKS